MDEFDVIDFVYEAIEAAGTGIAIYKDKSEAGIKDEHIVINHLSLTELDFINKIPVNVNVFVPLKHNGMYQRQRMKELKRMVRKALASINSDDVNCREIEDFLSIPIPDLKEGFMCTNIRFNVKVDN